MTTDASQEARDYIAREAARMSLSHPSGDRNYAEELQNEAHALAVRLLARHAEQMAREDLLSDWLTRLSAIHAEAMEAAAEWTPPAAFPGRMTAPYDIEHLSQEAVTLTARALVKKVQEDQS